MLQQYDPRNNDISVYIDGSLVHRKDAKISVFDSAVQGGDSVWEGLRVYDGYVFCLEKHLDRLFDSAHAMHFSAIPSREEVRDAIFSTLKANNMRDHCHMRLTLTRGEKITSGMDPRLNQNGCTLIVLAEWKLPVYDNDNGITVATSSIQRNSPRHLDSKIHHSNLINNILAKIQANEAGVDAALMLDAYGFVAELNGTNIFMVRKGVLYTPHADACLHGITRGLVMEVAESTGIKVIEKNLSLTEFYTADEVFCTGTMGELTPVVQIDGRTIQNKTDTDMLPQLTKAFMELIPRYGAALPF
jgi:branched-chain amino acid aminotransferase